MDLSLFFILTAFIFAGLQFYLNHYKNNYIDRPEHIGRAIQEETRLHLHRIDNLVHMKECVCSAECLYNTKLIRMTIVLR